MAGPHGVSKGLTLEEIIETWKANGYSSGATARALGCAKSNVIRRLRKAYDAGDARIDPVKLHGWEQEKGRTFEEVNRAWVELGYRREAKVAKGDWRKASLITTIKKPVFVLGLFGDPHLDNPGCDHELFRDELEHLANPDTHGLCIGDLFDNWVPVLAHAAQQSTDPYAAWIVFEDLMARYPFLSIVLGNHDLWNCGTASVIVEFCRTRGIIPRRSGGRYIISTGEGEPLTISARHIWQGSSIYSEAHNLKRAATFGHTSDDIVTGGHYHKGEIREHVRPADGKVQRLIALDSFKELDDYANDRGFMSAKRHPVVWCAIDTREPVTSHKRVQPFYSYEEARAMADHRKRGNGP